MPARIFKEKCSHGIQRRDFYVPHLQYEPNGAFNLLTNHNQILIKMGDPTPLHHIFDNVFLKSKTAFRKLAGSSDNILRRTKLIIQKRKHRISRIQTGMIAASGLSCTEPPRHQSHPQSICRLNKLIQKNYTVYVQFLVNYCKVIFISQETCVMYGKL